jgi:hypothetical protein
MKLHFSLPILVACCLLLSEGRTMALTDIHITPEVTPAFRKQKLQSGPIQVWVDYDLFEPGQDDIDNDQNLRYRITYEKQSPLEDGVLSTHASNIFLKDLDGDRTPEVIVETYSGGAHCCTSFEIYSWQQNKFLTASIGMRNGSGGSFKDIDGNGSQEFLSYDNSFLYTFSSYADSFPPTQIYNLRQGKLVETTRNYPKYLRERLKSFEKAIAKLKGSPSGGGNGVLAGYVAQKSLLGEFPEAWEVLLKNYDPESDWGLETYNQNGEEVGHYPDFPTAVKALLVKLGYLDASTESRMPVLDHKKG